jgi:hypothetical protein
LLCDARCKIGRYADIQDAPRFVGHDVGKTASRHALLLRASA